MPTDFTTSENDFTPAESEGSMFAPVPAWERNKKRRGFGMGRSSRVAPEPRSFAAEPEDVVVRRPVTDMGGPVLGAERVEFVEPVDTAFAATPVYADRAAARKGNGAAPIAIAAGVILLGGLAAAGWYASQPHDQGMAQLTPGTATTTTTTTAPTPDAALPAQMAQNDAPPAPVAKATTTTTTRTSGAARQHTTVTRSAPASASPTASDNAANASATAPIPTPAPAAAAPSAEPPAATAPAAPLKLDIPPAAAAAPTQAAPTATAPVETPVVPQTAPAPTQTPPTT